MLSTLKAKKRKLEADSKQVELEVLLYFLKNTRAEKQEVGSLSGADSFAIVDYLKTNLLYVVIHYPFFTYRQSDDLRRRSSAWTRMSGRPKRSWTS
jgi:hypothetical protein